MSSAQIPTANDAATKDKAAKDLAARVDRLLQPAGPTLRAGIWVADGDGNVLFAQHAESALPTASAIKVAYLVELFGAMAPDLGRAPARARQVLEASAHPALRPFAAEQQPDIRTRLDQIGRAHV